MGLFFGRKNKERTGTADALRGFASMADQNQRQQAKIKASQDENHQRGSELRDLSSPEARAGLATIDAGQEHPIRMGGVPLEATQEQQHFVLIGAPGVGKSVEIKQILNVVRQRGQRFVVFDPSGDFTSMFYRPGRDIVFNPLDARHTPWSPWADLGKADWASVAEVLVPKPTGQSDPFFATAAQVVLRALFRTCKDVDEVLMSALNEPDSALQKRVESIGMRGMIGPEKTFASVRATLAAGVESISALPPVPAEQSFSLIEWVKNDSDKCIFMPIRKDQQRTVKSVMSVFINTLVEKTLSLEPDRDRRLFVMLDEFPSLGKLPGIEAGIAEGRKFGLTFLLGLQATGQIKELYGKDGGSALLSMPKNRLIFRVADAESAEDASKELGDREFVRRKVSTSESSSVGHSDGGNSSSSSSNYSSSTNTNTDHVTNRIVLPSEIAGLRDLYAYLRTGSSKVYKVSISWHGLPDSTQPTSEPVELREMPWEREESEPENVAKEIPEPTTIPPTKENVMQKLNEWQTSDDSDDYDELPEGQQENEPEDDEDTLIDPTNMTDEEVEEYAEALLASGFFEEEKEGE